MIFEWWYNLSESIEAWSVGLMEKTLVYAANLMGAIPIAGDVLLVMYGALWGITNSFLWPISTAYDSIMEYILELI